ncbi:MAG: GNAT family N-acetyltransferase [Burkholderiales bacterium]
MELPERVLAAPVILRHFTPDDAADVRRLADDWEIARWIAALPYPYLPGMAEQWIAGHAKSRQAGGEHAYAITRAVDGALVGSIGVRPEANENGHFGYWVGRAHWGEGCATAATRAAIALLFAHSDLDLVWATHLADNLPSARVMEKCGLDFVRQETRPVRGEPRVYDVRAVTRAAWEALCS